MAPDVFKSGFVSIIGLPNAGKSTLLNTFLDQKLSVVNPKAQTTRHRILGMYTSDKAQVVFSDTPGFIKDPKYRLQEKMNDYIGSSFEDADIYVIVQDVTTPHRVPDHVLEKLVLSKIPVLVVLNKADIAESEWITSHEEYYKNILPTAEQFIISASKGLQTSQLLQHIIQTLPEGPLYYPEEQLTDRNERFFVSEIIRERILALYSEEVPYSVQVIVENFVETHTKKGEPLARIYAIIYVLRDSQKGILLGKGGKSIKRLGTESRKAIESFLGSKVFLEMTVKIRKNWRDDEKLLDYFGYDR